MHSKGTWSPGRSTHNQSLQGKGGGTGDMQAECQQRDKRGYSLYISLGHRTCKRTFVSDKVEAEGWSTSLLKRQRQRSATTKDRTCYAKWIPVRWLWGWGHHREINGCKSCCSRSDIVVGHWVQHECACAKSYGATAGWKIGSQGGQHGSTAGAMCCTQLWRQFPLTIITPRLKQPGISVHWIKSRTQGLAVMTQGPAVMTHQENKVPHMSNMSDVRQKGLSTVNVNQKANLVIHRLYCKK